MGERNINVVGVGVKKVIKDGLIIIADAVIAVMMKVLLPIQFFMELKCQY